MRSIGFAVVLLSSLVATRAFADVDVPTSASFQLNGGTLNLGGSALQVDGAFSLGAGSVTNATNVTIDPSATFDGGNGSVNLSGDWSDTGNFIAGTSHVNFVDGAVAQSHVNGNTSFANLSFVSTVGKSYLLQVGTTQTISNILTILGTAGSPIQIKSSTPGQVAFIDLLPGGSQNISDVGVSNVHATGQHLAPNLTNEGGSGDAVGWFGAVVVAIQTTPAPILSTLGMMLMALTLLIVGWRRTERGLL